MSCLAHLQVLSAQRGKTVRRTESSSDILICATGLLLCVRGDNLHGADSAAANPFQYCTAMGWATADLAGWVHTQPALSTLSLKARVATVPELLCSIATAPDCFAGEPHREMGDSVPTACLWDKASREAAYCRHLQQKLALNPPG